jgi:hypothetical protein
MITIDQITGRELGQCEGDPRSKFEFYSNQISVESANPPGRYILTFYQIVSSPIEEKWDTRPTLLQHLPGKNILTFYQIVSSPIKEK